MTSTVMTALLLVKASLLLSVTLLAVFLLRRAPAASRHRLWTLAFAALLALPLLPLALPALDVPLPDFALRATSWQADAALRATSQQAPHPNPLADSAEATPGRAEAGGGGGSESRATTPGVVDVKRPLEAAAGEPATRRTAADWAYLLLLAAWLAGASVAAGTLALSLLRVRRLSRSAAEITDPAWRDAADALGARLGLSRSVRLLASADVGTPMAAGILRPTIFLPDSASDWSAECREIVLAHEIAHLAVRDPLRHVTARLALSCYWFHPLAWIAARQGTLAREQACDEAVLALGTRPSTYARVLLDLAGSLRSPVAAHGALPMVERSLLETRLMAILNDSQPTITRRAVLPVLGMALLTCTVAAARPGAPTSINVGAGESAVSSIAAPARPAPPATVAPSATETGSPSPIATPRPDAPSTTAPDVAPPGQSAGQSAGRESACAWDWWDSGSFTGSVSTSSSGRGGARERIGSRDGDRVIQKSFGDLRLCMVGEGIGDRDWSLKPSQWSGSARRVIIESRRGDTLQRLELVQRAGARQTFWQIGGAERPFDKSAEFWRDRMLAALDTTWELSSLRGQVSSLRGEISSVRGQESSLRGEISSLRGEVSSMRGRASSVRGDESSLRGQISSIQGHVSSLRGQISSERGSISGLHAAASIDDPVIRERVAGRIAKHDAEIARIEREIRDYDAPARIAAVEQQIKALNAAGKVSAIEDEIRTFDLQSKVAVVERRITELDVAGKVSAIERQIEALDADRRSRQLEERRDGEVKQVEQAIDALR